MRGGRGWGWRVGDVLRVDQAPFIISLSFRQEPGQCWRKGGDDALLDVWWSSEKGSVHLCFFNHWKWLASNEICLGYHWGWEKGFDRDRLKTRDGKKANDFMSVPYEFQLFNGLLIFSFPIHLANGGSMRMECVLRWDNVFLDEISPLLLYTFCLCLHSWFWPKEKDPDTARSAVLPIWTTQH